MKPSIDLTADPAIRRILVLKWSAMGDVVISTAMFQDIRRAFPEAVIDLHTLPPYRQLFEQDPSFSELCTIDVRRRQGGWGGLRRWLQFVRSRHYDAVFDLQSNDRSRLAMVLWWLTGSAPRWRVGNHRRFPYNVARPPSAVLPHAFDMQRATLTAAGIPALTERPVLHPSAEHNRHAAELMAAHDLSAGNFAVLLPGSQAAGWLKRWGAQRYAALARLLRERGVAKVVLLGGPDELEECAAIAGACDGAWLVNLCGQTRMLDLVPLAAAARLIVANDTGTAHVASCTTTPMVVICGPTDPRRVKPVGENVRALQADIDCRNCYGKTCAHDHACMAAITPAMVLAALAKVAGPL
jgi:lipopolysaccharide heptosyltransferase II